MSLFRLTVRSLCIVTLLYIIYRANSFGVCYFVTVNNSAVNRIGTEIITAIIINKVYADFAGLVCYVFTLSTIK